MNIFESLENLQVSECCFDEIMGMVEEVINEDILSAIHKYKTKQSKDKLIDKALDNQGKELKAAAKREQRPEDGDPIPYEGALGKHGYTYDQGFHKSANRIKERRNPENKQAKNIMSKGVAKIRAAEASKEAMEDKGKSLGTNYANKEKVKLANKLMKQGEKEFGQGIAQLQATTYPANVLKKLKVSEACFNDIMDMVEELINELHAPTPASATAVFDRKAAKLQANTAADDALSTHRAESEKGEFHNRYPNNDTQHRYNYEGELRKVQGDIQRKGEKLSSGAKRLSYWAAKKKAEGKATPEMLDSGRRMVQAGIENAKSRAYNN